MALKDNENQWVQDRDMVKKLIVDYFSHLITDEGDEGNYDIPSGVCTELSNEDWSKLSRPYIKCDIDEVINHMGSLKASGPDG